MDTVKTIHKHFRGYRLEVGLAEFEDGSTGFNIAEGEVVDFIDAAPLAEAVARAKPTADGLVQLDVRLLSRGQTLYTYVFIVGDRVFFDHLPKELEHPLARAVLALRHGGPPFRAGN